MQVRAFQGNAHSINGSRFAAKSFYSIAALAFSPVFVFEAGAVRARARGPALHRWCPSLRWRGALTAPAAPFVSTVGFPLYCPLFPFLPPAQAARTEAGLISRR